MSTSNLYWCGTSLEDIRAFPKTAKISLGRELDRLERGSVPTDFKPLKSMGNGITGVYEIRTREDGDIFRVAFVAKFGNDVVVLHCWQKKTQQIADIDKKIIVKRYREYKETKR
ncbi:type II toxin-antitoxin system RelE/ParE family toxin [Granulosicoccus sp.]|nr:type II toxin-antitoxin system RelE/ParE family toxin [Granulosicoccus sp.]